MEAFEAFLVAFCHRVILSYKSTLLGLGVAIGVMLLGQAQSYPNHYVQLVAGLVLVPFLAWRDQKVKDGTLRLFVVAAIFFLPLAARAQAKPSGGTLADVAPSDPPPATPTRFGGCNKVGTFCYGPAANLSLVLFNLKTKDFAFGIVPGAGYGITLFANQPHKLGIAGFGSFKSSSTNSPASGMGSIVVSFAEYVHLGAAYEVLGGRGTPYLLGSVGLNL